MNKKIWDIYAPIYEKAMRGDRRAYGLMYERIPQVIQGKDVLEIATGPGLLAKHVAHAAHKMIAMDYSDGMIREAKKGTYPDNLTFEVADAEHLPYGDDSFDAVIIANALHIVPNPQIALREIDRVLKEDGLLIAPRKLTREGAFVLGIWDGARNGFGPLKYFARFITMLYVIEIYDILFFDWYLLCRSNFFPHFYPETKGIVGPQMFGYNKKAHIAHFIVYIPACALLALGCGLLFS